MHITFSGIAYHCAARYLGHTGFMFYTKTDLGPFATVLYLNLIKITNIYFCMIHIQMAVG